MDAALDEVMAFQQLLLSDSFKQEDPRCLIPELCRQFYQLGWVTGTGGGVSIKQDNKIYIAPSAVQKERIQPEDMFVYNEKGEEISCPSSVKKLRASQCTPLFMNVYDKRGAKLYTAEIDGQTHWKLKRSVYNLLNIAYLYVMESYLSDRH
jgi:hypothetical protein